MRSPRFDHAKSVLRDLPSVSMVVLPLADVEAENLEPLAAANVLAETGSSLPCAADNWHPPLGPAKKVSCVRAPPGIATSCTWTVSPKRVPIRISRRCGCQLHMQGATILRVAISLFGDGSGNGRNILQYERVVGANHSLLRVSEGCENECSDKKRCDGTSLTSLRTQAHQANRRNLL